MYTHQFMLYVCGLWHKLPPPRVSQHSRIKLRQGRIYGLRIPPKEHGYGASVSFA